ncbi:MAG: response regulator [Gammaproteobacteria bacterium]|nr:response regulator [Gammaproteobacteria bacterium]
MSEPRILIVEDEEKIAALLSDYLHQSGYATHWIADGDKVVSWVRENAPDLLLLDIMLPGKDGLSICREIRAFADIPVIICTARVEEIDRLLGLELGADDYICKPFSAREVVARVNAVLRRIKQQLVSPAENYRDLQISEDSFAVFVAGKPLDLTPVEFRLLALLAQKQDRVHSRDQLIDKIYVDGRIVSDRTVDSHVKNLRRKLIDATGEDDWIRSIYGVGYRLD